MTHAYTVQSENSSVFHNPNEDMNDKRVHDTLMKK